MASCCHMKNLEKMSRDNKSGNSKEFLTTGETSQQVSQKDSAFVHKAKSVLMLLQWVAAYLVRTKQNVHA